MEVFFTTKVLSILLKEYRSYGDGVLDKDNDRRRYSHRYVVYDVGIIKDALDIHLSCENSAELDIEIRVFDN